MKKNLKTIIETPKGKNLESINKKTLKITKNKDLIKKVKEWKLPDYHIVKPWKKDEYLRSDPDKKKPNNLDPKIKVTRKKDRQK